MCIFRLLLGMLLNENKFYIFNKARTIRTLNLIRKILGHRILIFNKANENRSLVGINNSLTKYMDSNSSQFQAALEIYNKYRERKISITQDDLDRFNHLSCPSFQKFEFKKYSEEAIWISALDALELFERDLAYLLGPSVADLLDKNGRDEKARVLRGIASECPSSFFGKGSKVTLARYRELVRATESGWLPLLAMRGIRPGTMPQISSESLEELRPVSAERLAA